MALAACGSANRKVYGAHKLWIAARNAGHDIGRDQVVRLMRTSRLPRRNRPGVD
jgi:putative transposase